MKEKNQFEMYTIKRLDNEEKSESLSKIYDLSFLNELKDIKQKASSPKIIEKEEDINYNKKELFLKVIKKTILSTNFYFKWKSERIKEKLISSHLYSLISLSLMTFIKNKFSSVSETKKEILTIYSNNSTNMTITNQTDAYSEIFDSLKGKISIIEMIYLFLSII